VNELLFPTLQLLLKKYSLSGCYLLPFVLTVIWRNIGFFLLPPRPYIPPPNEETQLSDSVTFTFSKDRTKWFSHPRELDFPSQGSLLKTFSPYPPNTHFYPQLLAYSSTGIPRFPWAFRLRCFPSRSKPPLLTVRGREHLFYFHPYLVSLTP